MSFISKYPIKVNHYNKVSFVLSGHSFSFLDRYCCSDLFLERKNSDLFFVDMRYYAYDLFRGLMATSDSRYLMKLPLLCQSR